MTLFFYPASSDMQTGTLKERLQLLIEAAETIKSIYLDAPTISPAKTLPREIVATYNWEEIARVMREVRNLPEHNQEERTKKSLALSKLADIYEILRSAKMPRLEAVQLALLNEANQLYPQTAQVA